jgi:hypothetical protein
MAVDVEVHLPKFGTPDFSFTARELGQRFQRPGHGNPPNDVWEIVHLVNGKVSLDPQNVAQIGACYYVSDLFIRVDFGLEYFIASDLKANKNNATQNRATANFYHWLLLRVQSHAKEHYEQFVKVIMTWEGDIKDDLVKTLPTDQKPTSLQELEIKSGIGGLVADWIVELEYRMKRAAFEWEKLDYPQIEAEMKNYPGNPLWTPTGFAVPPQPRSPASRRKLIFPSCRP